MVRYGTWLYRFLIFAIFLTLQVAHTTLLEISCSGPIMINVHVWFKWMYQRYWRQWRQCVNFFFFFFFFFAYGKYFIMDTVKPVLSGQSKRRPKIVFQYRLSLNAGQKYCRMLQESILQCFRPSLSYHLPLIHLICLFLSGRLRQVLLYIL